MGEVQAAPGAGNPLHGFPEPWCRRERDGASSRRSIGQARGPSDRLSGSHLVAWLALAGGGVLRLVERQRRRSRALEPVICGTCRQHPPAHRERRCGSLRCEAAAHRRSRTPAPASRGLPGGAVHPAHPAGVGARFRSGWRHRTVTGNAFVPEGFYAIIPRDPLQRSWGSLSGVGNPAKGRFESEPLDLPWRFPEVRARRVCRSDESASGPQGPVVGAGTRPSGRVPSKGDGLTPFVRCPDGRF